MRSILFIGLLVVGAFMAGWFTIQRDGEHTTIRIDRTEVGTDTKKLLSRGRDYLKKLPASRDQQGGVEGLQYSYPGEGSSAGQGSLSFQYEGLQGQYNPQAGGVGFQYSQQSAQQSGANSPYSQQPTGAPYLPNQNIPAYSNGQGYTNGAAYQKTGANPSQPYATPQYQTRQPYSPQGGQYGNQPQYQR